MIIPIVAVFKNTAVLFSGIAFINERDGRSPVNDVMKNVQNPVLSCKLNKDGIKEFRMPLKPADMADLDKIKKINCSSLGMKLVDFKTKCECEILDGTNIPPERQRGYMWVFKNSKYH
jgi:hypothetical protein